MKKSAISCATGSTVWNVLWRRELRDCRRQIQGTDRVLESVRKDDF
jgi:hypothetical protein